MRKCRTGFLTFMLAMIFVLNVVPSALAAETTVFNTSNATEENIHIVFEGSTIIFKDFPNHEDFNYVMLSLYGEDNKTYLKESYSTNSDIAMSVNGMADGKYWIQIYKAPEQYTTYWSYMYQKKGLQILVQNGMVTYVESPVYEHNRKMYNSNVINEALFECYVKPSSGIESDDKNIIKLAKSIVSSSDSDYEKVRKVHDWVAENVWYDWDGLLRGTCGNNNALEVLESKKAVCQGYANLAAALLRALEIPTKVVSGYALGVTGGSQWNEQVITGNETNHAWNEAFVDGRWVIFDATWDSNNKYENGTFSTGTGLDGYKYFDPTIESFSYDHKIVENENELAEIAIHSMDVDMRSVILYRDNKSNKTKKIAPKVGKYNGISLKECIRFTYKSENPSIAKVNKKGKVTAKKAGSTVVYVTAEAGGWTTDWSVNVTVR